MAVRPHRNESVVDEADVHVPACASDNGLPDLDGRALDQLAAEAVDARVTRSEDHLADRRSHSQQRCEQDRSKQAGGNANCWKPLTHMANVTPKCNLFVTVVTIFRPNRASVGWAMPNQPERGTLRL